MAPGSIAYSGLSIGKETTAGTLVAATRRMYPDGMGILNIDRMKTRHEGAQRGTSSNITYESTQGIAVDIPFTTSASRGICFDELPFIFCNLDGAVAPSAATDAITWTYVPVQTADPAGETLTLEVYSDTQEYEVGYVRARGFTLSAARGGMTQASIDWFGQTVAKSTKTTPVPNNALTIPAYLWTVKFATAQSGLTGASVSANFLRSFDLAVDTGYRPHFYLDGNAYMGQSLRSANLGGTLSMTVDDTALAVTELYDKAAAGTVDWVRLKATGIALSAANYDCQMDLAVLWDQPQIMDGDIDGVNTYSVQGQIVYDATYTNSMSYIVVSALTAYTA